MNRKDRVKGKARRWLVLSGLTILASVVAVLTSFLVDIFHLQPTCSRYSSYDEYLAEIQKQLLVPEIAKEARSAIVLNQLFIGNYITDSILDEVSIEIWPQQSRDSLHGAIEYQTRHCKYVTSAEYLDSRDIVLNRTSNATLLEIGLRRNSFNSLHYYSKHRLMSSYPIVSRRMFYNQKTDTVLMVRDLPARTSILSKLASMVGWWSDVYEEMRWRVLEPYIGQQDPKGQLY